MLPAHCRVDGIVDKRTGSDGKTYGIRFAVALPENWNSDYLQQGGGGLNGTVGEPIGNQATGDKPALARGFAVASSDTGHQSSGGGFDGSFMSDQQAALDFEFVAIGRLTVIAKQIIATYYGKPAAHSYYVGCSTGGREAMLMSQRYPLYFDGIVAGSPAMRTGYSGLATRAVTVALNAAAPKDASGKPGQALSESDKKAFIAKLLDECDARDGAKDGMIFDATGCTFRPRDLQCSGAKTEGCLSADQVAAIEKGFAGPKDSRGKQVYPGFFYDTGITAQGGGIPGLLSPGPSPLRRPHYRDHPGHRCTGGDSQQQSDRAHRGQLHVGKPGQLLFPRRQADLLSRLERSVVLRQRHDRLLPAHDGCQRRLIESDGLEPPFPFTRHGALLGRQRDSRQLRHVDRVSELGGEGAGS